MHIVRTFTSTSKSPSTAHREVEDRVNEVLKQGYELVFPPQVEDSIFNSLGEKYFLARVTIVFEDFVSKD